MLCWCETKEELDKKEIEYIGEYAKAYPGLLYNLAKGGNGGDVFYYNDSVKSDFIKKMTVINKERCSKDSFKDAISIATHRRFLDPKEREKQRALSIDAWSNYELREKQSQRISECYKGKKRDCSFNNIRCCLELHGTKIIFNSVKDLRNYMSNELNYTPDNRTFNRLLNSGEPLNPYHKNKLSNVIGLKIYKMNDGVETNRDECNGVGSEISTDSKDEAL